MNKFKKVGRQSYRFIRNITEEEKLMFQQHMFAKTYIYEPLRNNARFQWRLFVTTSGTKQI